MSCFETHENRHLRGYGTLLDYQMEGTISPQSSQIKTLKSFKLLISGHYWLQNDKTIIIK